MPFRRQTEENCQIPLSCQGTDSPALAEYGEQRRKSWLQQEGCSQRN